MNILPLVFAFLVIFVYLNSTFFHDVKSLQMTEKVSLSYHHTDKAIHNALVKRAFEKIKMPSSQEEKKASSPRLVNKRFFYPPVETSKFYLRSLHTQASDLKHHPLYEPLANLLRTLYQKPLFSHYPDREGIEYALIETLVKKANLCPTAHNLFDLYPDDPLLKTIYYKMVKGTNHYSKTEGIPPLAHYLSLEKSDKAFFLSGASEPVLEGLLGAEIKEALLLLEKAKTEELQKAYSLTKQDFEMLVTKNPSQSSALLPLEPFISYSKQSAKKKSLSRKDEKTRLRIERKLQ